MLNISVKLFKRSFVKQYVNPFTSGQAALGVLRIDPLLSATQKGSRTAFFQFGNV